MDKRMSFYMNLIFNELTPPQKKLDNTHNFKILKLKSIKNNLKKFVFHEKKHNKNKVIFLIQKWCVFFLNKTCHISLHS